MDESDNPVRMGILSRRADFNSETFGAYWSSGHGELAQRVLPPLDLYVQNHVIGSAGGEGWNTASSLIDGVSQLRFAEQDAVVAPEASSMLVADEGNFCSAVSVLTLQCATVEWEPIPGWAKCLVLLSGDHELSTDMALAQLNSMPDVLGLRYNRVVSRPRSAVGGLHYVAVAELAFPSDELCESALRSAAGKWAASKFTGRGLTTNAVLVKELVMVDDHGTSPSA